MVKKKIFKKIVILGVFLAVFLGGILAGFSYFKNIQARGENQSTTKNIYSQFLLEIYDKIKQNYWKSLSDNELTDLFAKGIENLIPLQYPLQVKTRKDLEVELNKILKTIPKEKKEEFTTKLANLVLNFLEPVGRSRLYAQEDVISLVNRVKNINPEKNLFKTLGVNEKASQKELNIAYQKKLSQLYEQEQKVPEKKEEIEKQIKETKYAFKVLSDPEQKQKYTKSRVEPSVFYKILAPDIAYIYIQKITPDSFEEFQRVAQKIDTLHNPHSLILDLRNNVGGAIDLLPFFLGPFIGPNQYAYELFHQGEFIPYKTKTGWLASLVRYKTVVVLVNENTQSSAELMAAVLKRYNVGVLVGTRTRGWGTIERVFELKHQINPDKKYSMFLVHTLTLRDDNQPIEGRGVEPLVNIKDPDWKDQLLLYFHYPQLIEKIEEVWHRSPFDIFTD